MRFDRVAEPPDFDADVRQPGRQWLADNPCNPCLPSYWSRYRQELAQLALQCYEEGADGISTFNWLPHHQTGMVKNPMREAWGDGALYEQGAILPKLPRPQALRDHLLARPPYVPENGKDLGTIFNSDDSGLLMASAGQDTSPAEYKELVLNMLDMGMDVLAQCVGFPDPVFYPTNVATTFDKHTEGMWRTDAMRKLLELGTDPFTITIEACREREALIVASYRMNAEDFYARQLDLYDFGQAHKDWAIPGANCLDPAIPEVYQHRMDIFTEVANEYDIDGIEFDFRRWCHMISDPHNNYQILTQMVRDTRKMLDEIAAKKGRNKLLLGVRVGAMLEGAFTAEEFPGGHHAAANPSCRDLGLDVETWIAEGLVDYVCPTLFWPRLPGVPKTEEFVELARGTQVGIHPTVFPLPAWAEDEQNPVHDSAESRLRHRDEIIRAALQCYDEGADGLSTFNWSRRDPDKEIGKRVEWSTLYGRRCVGYIKVLRALCPKLSSPQVLGDYLESENEPT